MDKNTNQLPPFHLTPRDYKILQLIGIMGGLISWMVNTLLFPNKKDRLDVVSSNCQLRLKLLKLHGYLNGIEQPSKRGDGRKHIIYALTRKGVRAVADYFGQDVQDVAWRKIDTDSSRYFLEHLMLINEVRVAFMYAVGKSSLKAEIVTWTDDAQMKKQHSKIKMNWWWPSGKEERNTVLVPDSYFHIETLIPEAYDYHFFLELDRGTMTGMSRMEERHSIERKFRMYRVFFEDGYCEKEYGTTKFRVLIVTSSEKRLENLKEIARRAGGKRFWFTTLDRLTPKTVLHEPIWEKATKEGKYTLL